MDWWNVKSTILNRNLKPGILGIKGVYMSLLLPLPETNVFRP